MSGRRNGPRSVLAHVTGIGLLALVAVAQAGLAPLGQTPGVTLVPSVESFGGNAALPVFVGSRYRLAVSAVDGEATVMTRAGRVLTRFPLVMLAGRSSIAGGVRVQVQRSAGALTATARTATGKLVSEATVSLAANFFTISFRAVLGPAAGSAPAFFDDGEAGLDWTGILQRLSPDPRGTVLSAQPSVRVGQGTAFSPPPFDLELGARAGWMGLGLVQVPDATHLYVNADGSVGVNYPLRLLATIRDRGAGGLVGHSGGRPLLAFPAFVFTFSSGPWNGLTAYHDALQSLGQAPQASPPGTWPAWWSYPIVDTWGQQMVAGAARTSSLYTSAWVRRFVSAWRARFGQRRITVVLDSQWQARIGEAQPSSRFGGVAGLRRLVSEFHQEGMKVVLWWPLWILGADCPGLTGKAALGCATNPNHAAAGVRRRIDPTAPGFAATTLAQMRLLLGHGPGEIGADGLKIDWGQLTPDPNVVRLSRPQLGVGAAALLLYLTTIHTDANQVAPGSLIESSAVAPQFGATTNMIRLYDAWGEATWQLRARIVSAVDPGTLIDGDDWAIQSDQAVAHAVSSTVYGTPAFYFLNHFTDGEPISPSLARTLGTIMSLARSKGQGRAGAFPDGNWGYWVNGRLTARTLGEDNAVAVYGPARCGIAPDVTVVSAVTQRIPVPGVLSPARVRLAAGVPAHLKASATPCAG